MMVVLDGSLMINRQAVHSQLQERLHLPEYYGCNLDALFDLLTERRELTEIRFVRWGAVEANLSLYAEALGEALLDAAKENPMLHVTIEK